MFSFDVLDLFGELRYGRSTRAIFLSDSMHGPSGIST